jgi:hypothetical protein
VVGAEEVTLNLIQQQPRVLGLHQGERMLHISLSDCRRVENRRERKRTEGAKVTRDRGRKYEEESDVHRG